MQSRDLQLDSNLSAPGLHCNIVEVLFDAGSTGTGALGEGAAPLQERLSLCCVQLLSRSVLVPLRPPRDAQPVSVLFLHYAAMYRSERRRAILMTRQKS